MITAETAKKKSGFLYSSSALGQKETGTKRKGISFKSLHSTKF